MGEEEKTVVLNNKHCGEHTRKIRFQFSKVFVLNGNYNYKRPKEQKLFKGVPLGVGLTVGIGEGRF